MTDPLKRLLIKFAIIVKSLQKPIYVDIDSRRSFGKDVVLLKFVHNDMVNQLRKIRIVHSNPLLQELDIFFP